MGTHISKVKSVDLDSWTDEQLQSVLSWGNARANKYWEAKLAPGHVPSESKIENFIRTKYELKRWVMDGSIPDPATLDVEGDDDVPLSVVKEKQNLERRETLRKKSVGAHSPARPNVSRPPVADLMGGDMPPRATSAGPSAVNIPPKAAAAPPKTTSTKDSLLGLDFLGGESAAPPRPASTTGTPGTGSQSRPDLKQSILSLYATAPRPQPPQQQTSSFGGMQSSGFGQQPQGSAGGLNDAFSSLSFGAPSPPVKSPPKSPQNDAFASLGGYSSHRPAAQPSTSTFGDLPLGGGSFFNQKSASSHKPKASTGSLSGFGAFNTPAIPAAAPKPAAAPAHSALDDLFDFSTPASPTPVSQPSILAPQPSTSNSVFNLTPAQAKPQPAPPAPVSVPSNLSGADVWGGNAWATPETRKKSPEIPKPATTAATGNDFGWGSFASQSIVPGTSGGFASQSIVPGASGGFASQSIVPGASGGFATAPKVAADEEFGGWASSTGAPAASGAPKPSGFGNDDLFSNVWE